MVVHSIQRSDGSIHSVAGRYTCSPTQYGNVERCVTSHSRIERGARLRDAEVAFRDASYNLHRIALDQEGETYSALIPISSAAGLHWFRGDQCVEVVCLDESPCLLQVEVTARGLDAQGRHTVQAAIGYFAQLPPQQVPPSQHQLSAGAYPMEPAVKSREQPKPLGTDDASKGGLKRVPSAHAKEGGLQRAVLSRLSDTDLAGRWGGDADVDAARPAYPIA